MSAFVSTAPEVLAAWDEWKTHVEDVRARRRELTERIGRRLMLNRLGFGHGTRVTGFERLPDDKSKDLIGDNGELRVPADRWDNTVVPNIRRKAGKDLRDELATLNQEGPDLPGMPGFQLVNMRSLAPALFLHEGEVWAFWGDDVDLDDCAEIDTALWDKKPLSAYYAVVEAREPEEAQR